MSNNVLFDAKVFGEVMAQTKKARRGSHYVYYNINPKKKETSDCVVRALATVYYTSWYKVLEILNNYAVDMATVPNDDEVWRKMLEDYNAVTIKTMGRKKRITAREFAKQYKEGTYVIQVANHLTACVDGTILDIWDCGEKMAYKAWKVSD